ncbi:hypothetical protein KCP69_14365 [Salmonella enterica subsp. enterica]|nr:hypothetical protein KCP69_14365 [Salmonella enterica subsp. enterica]
MTDHAPCCRRPFRRCPGAARFRRQHGEGRGDKLAAFNDPQNRCYAFCLTCAANVR